MTKLENLKEGLKSNIERGSKLEERSLQDLLTTYGNLEVLVNKSIREYSNEIAYPAQSLQNKIYHELNKRIKK